MVVRSSPRGLVSRGFRQPPALPVAAEVNVFVFTESGADQCRPKASKGKGCLQYLIGVVGFAQPAGQPRAEQGSQGDNLRGLFRQRSSRVGNLARCQAACVLETVCTSFIAHV